MMKRLLPLLLVLHTTFLFAQYEYDASDKYPYGKLNPNAPKEVGDYQLMIGTCDCKSVSRIDQTTWADTVQMKWTFKYIMNGWAVQDETLKADGAHSGSIRQFNADSSSWYVHYYSSKAASSPLSSWAGGNQDGKILLYKDQTAPNGTEGNYRIIFDKISSKGFNWVGAWTTKDESVVYPTWRIYCTKIK